MQPGEKVGEPSMEDILASIRKIIADDPNAVAGEARMPATPVSAPDAAPVRQPASGAPVAAATAPANRPVSALERDLADLLRDPADVPGAGPKASVGLPPAPPVPVSPPLPAATAASVRDAASESAWRRGRATGSNVTAAADPPARDSAAPAIAGQDGQDHLRVKPVAAEAAAPLAEGTKPAAANRPLPGLTIAVPVAGQTVVAGPSVQASASLVSNGVTEPPVAPSTGMKGSPTNGVQQSASMQTILERLGAAASGTGTPVPAPVLSRTFSTGAKGGEAGGEEAGAPANQVGSATPDAAAAAPVAPLPEAVGPAQPVTAPVAGPTPAGAQSKSAEEPAVGAVAAAPAPEIIPPGKASEAAPSSEVAVIPAGSAAATRSESTLDGTLAELLRPMVRQWLNENMTRALEHAVRIEVADSVRKVLPKTTPESKD